MNVTLAGVTAPEPATTLTDFGSVSALGFTVNALPPLATLALNDPEPVSDMVPVDPQAILNDMGDMLNGIVVTVSPFAPRTPSTVDVSTLRPVASVTINEVFPQPSICAVKLPPFVLTTPGAAINAKPGNGDTTEYGAVPPNT